MEAYPQDLPVLKGMREHQEFGSPCWPTSAEREEEASHVYPISQASGDFRPYRGWPGGQDQNSRFQNRVEPMTEPSSTRMMAKGTAVPDFCQFNAVPM